MKRILMAIVWFVVLGLGGIVIGGGVAGGIAGSGVNASSASEAYEKGGQAGEIAGAEFGEKYGGVVLLLALAVSVVGSATGMLPGTRKKSLE